MMWWKALGATIVFWCLQEFFIFSTYSESKHLGEKITAIRLMWKLNKILYKNRVTN